VGSPQLDWSFSNAPDDAGPSNDGAPQPAGPSLRPRSRRFLSRRLIVASLGLAALLALGAWLFTRVGLQRLQTQLAPRIVEEDKRALAGDVPAVLALQTADEPAWREQLSAQVRLGLAAPLPAGDLLPAGTPPRLSRLDPLGGDLFAAVVTRDYVDSAGETFSFDLVQRYRNLAPGQWERLPPDTSVLSTTTVFQGQRLSVTVPTADLPWLRPALLQADDFLVQTCADWGNVCPSGLRLAADFGAAQSLAAPILTAPRPTSGYPRIFDMATALLPYTYVVHTLPAPLLAGRPHDPAAQAALSRSLSVQLLSLFTDKLAGSTTSNTNYFLDALVARAEVRYLGIEEAPQILSPKDYVPLDFLWQMTSAARFDASWRNDLAWRREAFDFLNFALAGQPPSVDGKLIRSLRVLIRASLVDDWLGGALGSAASGVAEAWTQPIVAEFAHHAVADWSRYQGLLMACDEGVYQIQDGTARRLLPEPYPGPDRNSYLGEVSPDGRYVVLNYQTPNSANPNASDPWTELDVMDLVTGVQSPVAAASFAAAIGWSSTNSLVYWSRPDDIISPVQNSHNNQPESADIAQLRTYQPATHAHGILIPDWGFASQIVASTWSTQHTTLLLTLAKEIPGGQYQTSTDLLSLGAPSTSLRVAPPGEGDALSPDGSRVAYFGDALAAGTDRINLLDLTTGNVVNLMAANGLGLPRDNTSFGDLRWSADGRQIAWTAYSNPGVYLFSALVSGGRVRVWADRAPRELMIDGFAPDGQYLKVDVLDLPGALGQFWLVDPQAASVRPSFVGSAYSTIWTPEGHRLVMAGPAGVSAVDPATGEYEWLGNWQNCQLRW
jgi:hypothetical protein